MKSENGSFVTSGTFSMTGFKRLAIPLDERLNVEKVSLFFDKRFVFTFNHNEFQSVHNVVEKSM